MLDNPGSVEDGNGGVRVLLAAPTWKGGLPKGIKRVIRGDTSFLGTLTRTQLFEPKDLPNVQKIQKEYKLQPLSTYLGKQAPKAVPEIKWMPWKDKSETTEAFWSYVNFLLPYTTPNPEDKDVLARMAKIGLEPGKPWDESKFDKDVRDVISAGMKDALAQFKDEATKITDPSASGGVKLP